LIKQREDGVKIDSLLITTQPKWIAETVYSDAEDMTTQGWDVFDADPAGALMTNDYDQDRESYVIHLAGSGIDNGYRLRSKNFSNWANKSQFVIEWSMKYSENFVIYVEIQTSVGTRHLQYEPLDADKLGRTSPVRLGLGSGTNDGQWHTFVRDLQADLNKAQVGVKIQQVNSFSIRGSGVVDNVRLRQTL
jgi:hypothetical protein